MATQHSAHSTQPFMPPPLNTVLAQIAAGKPPANLLIGGSSDYLSEQAFRDLRDAAVAATPSLSIEAYEPGAELATILDSYRTMSLFGSARLLIVPEVNAFVSAKELTSLFDKALLTEAIARGGAPGTILLMRTGEIPRDSATVELIGRHGAVVVCDITRESFAGALEAEINELAKDADVRFDGRAIAALRARLGIERVLADKFSRDVPDLRGVVSEAERLITLAGTGGRVTAEMVEREVASVEGGARYEFGSLFTEGKIVEAVSKLRDLDN